MGASRTPWGGPRRCVGPCQISIGAAAPSLTPPWPARRIPLPRRESRPALTAGPPVMRFSATATVAHRTTTPTSAGQRNATQAASWAPLMLFVALLPMVMQLVAPAAFVAVVPHAHVVVGGSAQARIAALAAHHHGPLAHSHGPVAGDVGGPATSPSAPTQGTAVVSLPPSGGLVVSAWGSDWLAAPRWVVPTDLPADWVPLSRPLAAHGDRTPPVDVPPPQHLL
jgi:hypothetical protein